MNIINDIFQNGSLWALIGAIVYVYSGFEPVLKSHLRNNHEKSLLSAANRIVSTVAKVTDATPSDRKNEAVAELNEFASKRNIPVNQKSIKQFINYAVANLGITNQTPHNIHVSSNGTVKEDSND